MPIKINALKGNVTERINALRKTIKDGEGMTISEVAAHPTVMASKNQAGNVLSDQKWGVLTYVSDARRSLRVLVNPKEMAKHGGGK